MLLPSLTALLAASAALAAPAQQLVLAEPAFPTSHSHKSSFTPLLPPAIPLAVKSPCKSTATPSPSIELTPFSVQTSTHCFQPAVKMEVEDTSPAAGLGTGQFTGRVQRGTIDSGGRA